MLFEASAGTSLVTLNCGHVTVPLEQYTRPLNLLPILERWYHGMDWVS